VSELILTSDQKQVFSQRSIQIVEILQMSAQELERFLSDVSCSNPLVDQDASYSGEEEPTVHTVREAAWDDGSYRRPRQGEPAKASLEELIPQEVFTTQQRIFIQLLPYVTSHRDEYILRQLIDCLDGKGYLSPDCAEQFNLPPEELERYIGLLQRAEPAGVGARNLAECLTLQLRRLDSPEAELAVRIVSEYLEDVARNRVRQIARRLKLGEERVTRAVELIRTLNPKPINGLDGGERTVYIRPDILVEEDRDGLHILLYRGAIHRLVEDRSYVAMAESADQDLADYIHDKRQELAWLNKCLEQRDTTLMRLANLIVALQNGFFRKGPNYLRPLEQSEAGSLMEVSESTISRAIRDKHLQCRWGTFPLKYFFPKCADSSSGATADTIKRRLRELIDGEDKRHPLSDQKITDLLDTQGINISRRAIAKYRDAMGIPDTSRRRER